MMAVVFMVLGSVFGLVTYAQRDGVTDPLLWMIWGAVMAGLSVLCDIRRDLRAARERDGAA